jgi:type IV pilus assembly protein PilO
MTVMLDSTAAGTQRMTERTRRLLNLRNLHFAGVGVLALICLYLLIQMMFAWRAAKSQDAGALAQQKAAMQSAEVAARPLAGLDDKLKLATIDADQFYQQRLPFSYSEVAGELGTLAKRQNVKLSRVQYAEAPVLVGGVGALTEVRMDASLTGDYRPLVLFINSLERDRMFFMIRAVALTGQQSGAVGVRLRITTYLRSPAGVESVAPAVPGDAGAATLEASPNGGVAR